MRIKLISGMLCALMLSACVAARQDVDNGYGDYVAGQYARSISDTGRAAEFYYRALENAPGNRAILQEAFSLAIIDGRFDMAVDLAMRLKAAGYPNAVASMLLSLRHFKTRRYAAALEDLSQARGTGFDSLVSPLVKAWINAADGDTDAALASLDPLGEVSVFRGFKRSHEAFILDYGGRDEQAEATYKQLLSDDDLSVQTLLAYGAFLERHDRAAEAEDLYRAHYEAAPGIVRLKRALEVMEGARPKRQRSEIVTDAPEAAIAFALLRAANQLSGDNARMPAVLYARLATYLRPEFDEANLLLGNLFIAFSQPETAIKAFANVSFDSPFSDIARIREAIALDDMGETAKAYAALQEHLERDPANSDVRTALGDIKRTHEDYEGALAEYELAVSVKGEPAPGDWFLYFARGICHERLGRWRQAEADMKMALELRPDEPQVLNYLGYSWIDRGENIDEARAMIERAVEQRPNDGFIVDSLGWVQYLLGNYEDAVKTLERAILLEPDDATINDHLGDAYWQVGRRIEARFQWNHALLIGLEESPAAIVKDKIAFGLMPAGE